uniref:Torsin family 3 member A n=1 Tax=Leptobrachium leishanense TaxID=445787 RepID=A0A8C5QFC5_9ANUR
MHQAFLLALWLLLWMNCLSAKDVGQTWTELEKGDQGDATWFLGAHEVQDLAQLSWDYVQCWFSPEKCEESGPGAWGWPRVGWDSLQFLSDWYIKVSESRGLTHGRITNNLTGLQWDLSRRVHGQHLAKEQIVTFLKRFLQASEPKTSLTLSFHGWSGTGKSLVTRIIAENLYEDGVRSPCIKVFFPQLHFPHISHLEAYKVQLERQIKEVSLRCAQPLFVFDEADQLPQALLASIYPHSQPDTTHVPAIFLFLSTVGSKAINEVALTFWRAGRHREEITMDDLDRPLKASIRESEGDYLLLQALLSRGLIDALAPFLPLERSHVKLCAQDSFVARGLPYTETTLDLLTKELLFVPKEEKLFSAQGCKLVAQRINFL